MRKIPEISISRLALYLRFLQEYEKEKGAQSSINSSELARGLDMNPHQIRKDLSYFGKFGERGIGYRIDDLQKKINLILGLGRQWHLCICGIGNLGSALLAYRGFKQMRLNIVAAFDTNEKKIGHAIAGVRVFGIAQIPQKVKQLNLDMAIIAVPASAAQEITSILIRAGVRAILNFAPVKLNVPAHVKLRNVDLSSELVNLAYFLSSPS